MSKDHEKLTAPVEQPLLPLPGRSVITIGGGVSQGILMILLGIAAIFYPSLVTFGVEIALGVVLIGKGLISAFNAVTGSKGGGVRARSAVVAVLALIAGVFLLHNPLAGVITLTTVISVYFVAAGLMRWWGAVSNLGKRRPAISLAFSGTLLIFFGLVLWNSMAFSSMLMIGYMIGVILVYDGIVAVVSRRIT